MSEDDAGSSNAQREYLRQKLLEPLSLGLAEVCHVRPADPIQYLADWLRHFRELQLKKAGDRETSETVSAPHLYGNLCPNTLSPTFFTRPTLLNTTRIVSQRKNSGVFACKISKFSDVGLRD